MRKNYLSMFLFLFILVGAASMASAGDKASFDLDWYGYFKLDGSYDQNQTSHGNFVIWVKDRTVDKDDKQFNMTANQTRFGLNLKGKGYENVDVKAKLEFDLYAGVTGGTVAENKPMLQLRHAYFTVKSGGTMLLAGQSWDLISPLNPSTLNYPVLWGCGNMGYRRPQVTVFQTINAGPKTDVTVAAGFFRTIGSDLTPTFSLATGETADGSDDGTDAAIPSVQSRLDVQHKFASGTSVRFGASGLWGQLNAETTLGNEEKYESWAATGHAMVSFAGGFGLSGEYYTGSNLGGYYGGILNASTVDGTNAVGYWASAWMQVSPKVKLSTGFGIDDPDDEDISAGSRSKNQSVFGNITYALVPGVQVGLEVSHWETDYSGESNVDNMRVQTSFVMNF